MADERFFGDVLVSAKSAFASTEERQRMAILREKIQIVRRAWLDPKEYRVLVEIVKRNCKLETRPREVREPLQRLLDGYRDYADVVIERPQKPPREQYDALELYCSTQGYRYLFGLMTEALRDKEASDELLLTATAIVEFLTIDLYNRGIIVSRAALAEYQAIEKNPDLSQRSFSIPLGLLSTSSEEAVMQQYAEPVDQANHIRMYWIIHIHGVDPGLLEAYQERYPDSIVTSICAMPVARVSPYGEKEVLLRGAFFHLIKVTTEAINGYEVAKLEVVMINANRDHTTEQASNEGEKEMQREAFRRIVMASRYEVCASLAGQYSTSDADKYACLQQQMLNEIREKDKIFIARNDDLADSRSTGSAVWLGASLFRSYPRHYAVLRQQWQEAITKEDWGAAEDVLLREYDWQRRDWYNVGKLRLNQESVPRQNLTLLHELATSKPPDQANEEVYQAWKRLVDGARSPSVWKSLKSFDQWGKTAETMALEQGLEELAKILQPKFVNNIDDSVLGDLERQLHLLMRKLASNPIDEHGFHMPQLSVFKEMEKTELWIPIPYLYGGFFVRLVDQTLEVTFFEAIPGYTRPRESKYWLFPSMR